MSRFYVEEVMGGFYPPSYDGLPQAVQLGPQYMVWETDDQGAKRRLSLWPTRGEAESEIRRLEKHQDEC